MSEKYSIWALPEQQTEQNLQALIAYLSFLYGGPIFQPHLTIIGDVEKDKDHMIEVTHKLVEDLNQLLLKLSEISFSTTFFQSVFIRALASTQLMDLNLDAKRLLKIENNMYMPHVSLLYGTHSMKIREEAVGKVALTNKDYNVDRFVIVPSTNNPSEWEILYQVVVKSDSHSLL